MTRLRSGLRTLYFAHRVRFSGIARILCCSHSVRISRGADCLMILQFLQFVDCVCLLKFGSSTEFVSGSNRVDGFDCLRCSHRSNCSDCRDRFDCSDCPDCPSSPHGFHRARSPPGFDCSNAASDVARVTISPEIEYSAALSREYCGHRGVPSVAAPAQLASLSANFSRTFSTFGLAWNWQ